MGRIHATATKHYCQSVIMQYDKWHLHPPWVVRAVRPKRLFFPNDVRRIVKLRQRTSVDIPIRRRQHLRHLRLAT